MGQESQNDLNKLLKNLDVSGFETIEGETGKYFLFAKKGDSKAFLSVLPGNSKVKNPKNPASSIYVTGLVIRIRVYENDNILTTNPMPGFKCEPTQKGGYWKYKRFFPVSLYEKGAVALQAKMKEAATADLIAALKAAAGKNRSKIILSDEKLQYVVERWIEKMPNGGRAKVYSGFDFSLNELDDAKNSSSQESSKDTPQSDPNSNPDPDPDPDETL